MRARWFAAAAVVAYGLLAASVFTSVYDPLPDFPIGLSLALLVLPQLALGLAAPRWWAVPLPICVALPWAIAGDTGNAFSARLSALEALAVATLAAAVVMAGVLVATSPDTHLGRLRGRWPVVAGCVLLVSFVPLGWAALRAVEPVDERPADPLTIDEVRGAVGATGLGHSVSAVTSAFGAARPSPSAPVAPLGERFDEIAAPAFIATPGETHSVLRYRGVSFLISDAGVYAVILTAGRAETAAGIGIGDNLEVARDAHPELDCAIGETVDERTFPYCSGRLSNGRYAWFGDDPIRSIVLATTELSADADRSASGLPQVPEASSPMRS